ncbi:MAG: hypothetical protein Q7R59_01990 [bacterium]|nr:hypothetical protein [bacterium]
MKSSLLHFGIWITVCIAAIAGQGFWYAVIANKSVAIADLQNQIDTKIETADRIASARSALAEIAGDESAVQSYFVPETGVVSFINNLEMLARGQTAVLKVLSVSIGGADTQPTLVFSLSVSGTFDAVMRTIGAIEYAPYNLSISKLALGEDGKNSWHADAELTVGSVSASAAMSTQMI